MVISYRGPKSLTPTPPVSPGGHEDKTDVFPPNIYSTTALEESPMFRDLPPPAYEIFDTDASFEHDVSVRSHMDEVPGGLCAWRVRNSSLTLTVLEATVAVKRGLYTYDDFKVSTPAPTRDAYSSNRANKILDDIKYNRVSSEVIERAPRLGNERARGIMGLGLQAPMIVTMQVSKGFHYLPCVYGDEVRKLEKVTSVKSGLHAAGKGFGLGLWDGLSGLVTQPVNGAREGGIMGGLVGFGKGIGGVAFKPAAGAVGIPGNVLKGIYKEVRITGNKDIPDEMVAAQIVQGLREWDAATENDREAIFEEVKRKLQARKMMES